MKYVRLVMYWGIFLLTSYLLHKLYGDTVNAPGIALGVVALLVIVVEILAYFEDKN